MGYLNPGRGHETIEGKRILMDYKVMRGRVSIGLGALAARPM